MALPSPIFAGAMLLIKITIILALSFLSGISFCLSLWIMTLLPLAAPRYSAVQFNHTVTMGGRYLQPSARILGLSLLTMAILTYNDITVHVEGEWKAWASVFPILAFVAPYEIYAIFPINERVRALGSADEREVEKGKVQRELETLYRRWQVMNFGRIAPPALASGILVTVLMMRE